MISNISSNSGTQSLSRSERSEKLEKALEDNQIKLAQLSPEQLAANRSYGHQLVSDIDAARCVQAASGQSDGDFQALSSRLVSH